MLLYDISAVRPEQSQPRVWTDCGSSCPTPSPALQPRSLSKNKQTTHCKLDLAATHDVVQERMHLVDLHRRRGSCIRTVWSEYLHIKGLSMGFADLEGRAENKMAGWHHQLDEHEFEWTSGVGDGQGGLACCDSWGRKELDMTERLNWTELNISLQWGHTYVFPMTIFSASYQEMHAIQPQGVWGTSLLCFPFFQ